MPPQEQNWDLPPVKPLIVPCLLSSCCAAVMAILPGMTAAQATVVVRSARNFWGRLTDPDYIPGLEMSVVIVHHTRKGQGHQGNTFESIRGAGFLYGWFDSGLMLGKKGSDAMLSFELRNGEGMDPKLVSLNTDTLRFEEIEAHEEKQLDPFIEKMLLGLGDGWHSGNSEEIFTSA